MARTFSLADLPESVPIFPLPGALLLPRARLPLNIFEPRYLAMLEDALKTPHRLIGMIQPVGTPEGKGEGKGEAKGGERLHRIGCAGRVTALQETEDGRYLITLSGVSRFRLAGEVEGFAPYRRAEVDWSGFERDLGRSETCEPFDRAAFLDVLARFFDAAQLSSDWDSLKGADAELLVNSLSILCPFDPEEKQALLEAPTLEERRRTLVTLMEFALRSGGDDGALQ
ncbi:LON peptidase substrate-binding domain-containing protein [Amaricoccus sp.]|uniref:LON peptidase substrate-binding domain-containing protein n=1 Tax=Amaricoccus sp. TaxID=1872485 RepID=UPI001B5B588D|nr:LON peptidase substrate-binding domain-containing protein [Amaricoccus sp.]MBP7003623.1 LON peptidase substrate-binding domain-containing protein [Amaricoccus sp.]